MSDFYIDMGFAVLFRLLKDKGLVRKWRKAIEKLHAAAAVALDLPETR